VRARVTARKRPRAPARVLRRLKAVWLGLAREQRISRDPEMQEDIAALERLHAKITAAGPTLH